jgi:hypothetical protein
MTVLFMSQMIVGGRFEKFDIEGTPPTLADTIIISQ